MKAVHDQAVRIDWPAAIDTEAAEGRGLGPGQVRDADILVVRSYTAVSRELLEGSRVRLVATASAGFDHIDTHWLAERGIGLVTATGANARSVAEYTLVCLLMLARRHGLEAGEMNVAIVGFGNIGTRLYRLLAGLGCAIGVCDPWRRGAEPPAALLGLAPDGHGWLDFGQALERDFISLHVPLVNDGEHPTRHMLEAGTLARLAPQACLVNSSRGPVHRSADLADWAARSPGQLCLDVYENEPRLDETLVQRAFIATPHIAGHTVDSRQRIESLLSARIRRWLDRPGAAADEGVFDDSVAEPGAAGRIENTTELLAALRQCTDPAGDGEAFLRGWRPKDSAARARHFHDWRQKYLKAAGARREFGAWTCGADHPLASLLHRLGFAKEAEGKAPNGRHQ